MSGEPALRAYISALLHSAQQRVPLAVALMVARSFTQGIGLLLLIPLLHLVGFKVQGGTTGRLHQFALSAFTAVGLQPTLVGVLSVYVVFVTLQVLLQRSETIVNLELEQGFVLQLRQRLFRAISYTGWLFFSRRRASDFTHALTMEIDRVGAATHSLLSIMAGTLVAVIYVVLALQLSATITLVAFASGIVLVLVMRRSTGAARLTGEQLSATVGDMLGAVTEHLAGMKTTKGYGLEGRNVALFAQRSEQVSRAHVLVRRNYANVSAFFSIGSVLILALLLYLAVEVFGLPAAGVLLLLLIFSRLVPRFSGIQQSYQYLINALPAFSTVMETIRSCEAAAETRPTGGERIELRQGIRLDGVSFRYELHGQESTIRDLNLSIPARETTAIVGPSGAGKTTVADLVMGLVIPESGQVLVDEVPLSAEQMQAWRERIGYVPQDTFLFHDTVRANLLWAHPDAREEELWESLRLAAAEAFVSRLPQGLDTVLGDRGVRLSGGERQRLALARALLRKPSLLILDEATSALDSENERRIQRAIEELHGDITILVITHRLSTIRGADVIYVLENGRLVESGSWDDLVADPSSRFHALWREQGVQIPASSAVREYPALPLANG